MTRKDVKWNQRERQQKAFEKLTERFMTELILVISDLNKEMRVEANILDFVTDEVLLMKCKDEKWRYVAYIQKSLNEAEINYKFHNKEILAIIRCLKVWRYFLEGKLRVSSKFEWIIKTWSTS